MKNLYRALVMVGILSCCSLFADPLNNWHWRNPLPNGNPVVIGTNILYGVIFTNGTFFGIGANGAVATSTDGRYWVENPSAAPGIQLNAIAYGGGQFVAVGAGGNAETSPDGTNWVLQNPPDLNSLYSVVYANGIFVAVGSGSLGITTSTDGVNWTEPPPGQLESASGVAGCPTGFVAIGGTNAYFSTDGLYWTTNILSTSNTFSGFRIDTIQPLDTPLVTTVGNTFVVAGFQYVTSASADMFMFTSSDGIHWTTNSLGNIYTGTGGFNYNFFMNGNNGIIACGQANYTPFLQYSTNGVNWSQTNINLNVRSPSVSALNAGASGNGSYIILGPPALDEEPWAIYISTNSVNWTNEPYSSSPPTGSMSTFNSIAYSNGTYVVATADSFVASTNDLTYAIESNTPSLSSVIMFGNTFVSVGADGQIYQSPDDFSWTPSILGVTDNLHSVAAGNNQLVAVGDNGAVLTSPTGTIWTSQNSGTALPLLGVAYWPLRCRWPGRDDPDLTGRDELDGANFRGGEQSPGGHVWSGGISGGRREWNDSNIARRGQLDTAE
jgi:hypothetical protein